MLTLAETLAAFRTEQDALFAKHGLAPQGSGGPVLQMAQDPPPQDALYIRQIREIMGEKPNIASGEALMLNDQGAMTLLPASAVMSMRGGLLSIVEDPLNKALPKFHLGSVLVGGVVGMVLGGVVDGVVNPRNADGSINFANVALKAGSILALGMWGGKLMGTPGQIVAIGVIGIQVLIDVVPQLGRMIDWIVAQVRRLIPAGTMAQHQQTPVSVPVPHGLGNGYAPAARQDLYAGIFG